MSAPVSDEAASTELLTLVTAAVDRYLAGTIDLDGEHPGMTFESPQLGQRFTFAVNPTIAFRRESYIATIHGEFLAAWRYSVGRDEAA